VRHVRSSPKADIPFGDLHVRFVPEADVKLKPGVPADIDSRRRKQGWHSLNNDPFFRVWLRPHHKEVVA
jgi:hypothetical protein